MAFSQSMRCIMFVAFAVILSAGAASARTLAQVPKAVTATVLLTRTPLRDQVGCTASIIVKDSNGALLPAGTVSFKWGTAATTSNANLSGGRATAINKLPAGTKSCSLQLVDVVVPGATVALADASRTPKSISL